MSYSLYIKKENFKFSSSHFTIFGPDEAEALHGHNYLVGVRISFKDINKDIDLKYDFNEIKKVVRSFCERHDEKILIPEHSPYLKIQESPHYKNHTEVIYADRHYCFPTQEVLKVPVANITSEALARYAWSELSYRLPKDLTKVVVFIKETAGQTAAYTQ